MDFYRRADVAGGGGVLVPAARRQLVDPGWAESWAAAPAPEVGFGGIAICRNRDTESVNLV
jgi:hypothetical protein